MLKIAEMLGLPVWAIFLGVAVISAIGGGWAARVYYTREIANMQLAAERDKAAAVERAHKQRDAAIDAGRKMTDALMDLNKETEGKYADAMEEINDMYVVNGRFIAATGGLYDKNGRPTGRGSAAPAGTDPAGAGSAGGAAPGCTLSDAVTEDLRLFARDADGVVAVARSCKTYALGLRRIIENRCQPIAAPSQ